MKSIQWINVVAVAFLTAASAGAAVEFTESFDTAASASSHGWSGAGNTSNGNSYEWSSSARAGGPGGEAGGFFNHATVMSYYGVPLGGTFDLSATFHGTGCVAVASSGPAGILNNYIAVGFLNTARAGGLQKSLLGITVQEQDSTGKNWRGRCGFSLDNGSRVDGTPGVWLMPTNYTGTYTFSFDYVPNGGNSATGALTAKLWKNGTLLSTMTASLTGAQRASGATFNAFGLATGGMTDANDSRKYFYLYADNLSGSVTGAPQACVGAFPTSVACLTSQTNQTVAVAVPQSMNGSRDAYVTITSQNPTVATPVNASGGSLTLRFPAGNTSPQSFAVSALSAGSTTFVLSNTNGVCTSNSVAVTVLPSAFVQFAAGASSGAANGSLALLPVVLTQPQTEPVTLDYAASGGTAVQGADYQLDPGTLTFSPGETNKSLSLLVASNSIPRPSKTIVVTLSNPSTNAQLGSLNSCVYTITNAPGPWNLNASFSGTNLLLSWPVYTAPGYQLQYRPDLVQPPGWSNVACIAITNGDLLQVVLPRTNATGFFRLAPISLPTSFVAEGYQRRTIYHSPQTPGYTCWVGAWIMPDESLMFMCHQATGPLAGHEKIYDYSGLQLANVYFDSTDDGTNWNKTAEDQFLSFSDRPTWGGSHCALADGAILRAVDGSQLPSNNVPRRIYFQRSLDRGLTWGPPEIPPEPSRPAVFSNYIGDFADCISRVRRLSDGRLLATGVKRYDPSSSTRLYGEPVFMFSSDNGTNWSPQTFLLTGNQATNVWGAWNEWDCAELPGGDFLGVFRRTIPTSTNSAYPVRYQGRIHKTGNVWVVDQYGPAPFPHSGHPELLATREGAILHIATTGIHWTTDAGTNWTVLPFTGLTAYTSRYYPRSVQLSNGLICVISHVGSDNWYGQYDQSVTLDYFRLRGQ